MSAQYLDRTIGLPEDTLITKLLPSITSTTYSKWHPLSKSNLWQTFEELDQPLSMSELKKAKREFVQQSFDHRRTMIKTKFLSLCRPKVAVDPILWLPMTREERSRCVRWRLGWLPNYSQYIALSILLNISLSSMRCNAYQSIEP